MASEPLHPHTLLTFIIYSYYYWATPIGSNPYAVFSTPASPASQADTGLPSGEVSDFMTREFLFRRSFAP
ncbi:MAG: hypothetical protein HG447_008430 [Prevotella sp.]|nr:hypothetical protein [Prevotella sp.]